MYSFVSEKPLRLFIPLIFSGGIWAFLHCHPVFIQRLFTNLSLIETEISNDLF